MLQVTLHSDHLNEDDINDLCNQLLLDILRDTDIEAIPLENDAIIGHKGDTVTVGAIVLSVISSGSLVALFEIFKTYFAREPSVQVEINKKDGSKIKLSAQNCSAETISKTLSDLKDALK